MRRLFVWFLVGKVSLLALCVMAVVLYVAAASAQRYVPAQSATPIFHVEAVAPELPQARAYAIFDPGNGGLLVSQNDELVYPIASVTKLSAAAAVESLGWLDATTTVAVSDVAAEGRAGKLVAGTVYRYRELLFPLLLESSNDAAAALERADPEQLLLRMNERARTVGTQNTSFVDASGLSDKNVSTARDLAMLTAQLYKDHPYIFDITTLSQYIGPQTGWVNNNPVVHQDSYLGGKHGYTEAAQRTIVAIFDEEFATGRRQVGYVVLGSKDLEADINRLRAFVAESVRYE